MLIATALQIFHYYVLYHSFMSVILCSVCLTAGIY